MVSYFVLSFLPGDVLDEGRDRIESVPENFPTINLPFTVQNCFVKQVITMCLPINCYHNFIPIEMLHL